MLGASGKILAGSAIRNADTGTPWDVSGATYDNKSKLVSAQAAGAYAVKFGDNGTKMYIADLITAAVYQYTVSTAWDASTATYASKFADVDTEVVELRDMAFSSDGTKLYVIDSFLDTVFQYTLSTAWDASTAVYASKSLFAGNEDTNPLGFDFSTDGTKVYVLGGFNNEVFQYTLSPAWDVGSAVYANKSYDATPNNFDQVGMAIGDSDSKLYLSGVNSDSVVQYNLSIAGDISSASPAGKVADVSNEAAGPWDVSFSADGTKMYILDATSQIVYQYAL